MNQKISDRTFNFAVKISKYQASLKEKKYYEEKIKKRGVSSQHLRSKCIAAHFSNRLKNQKRQGQRRQCLLDAVVMVSPLMSNEEASIQRRDGPCCPHQRQGL